MIVPHSRGLTTQSLRNVKIGIVIQYITNYYPTRTTCPLRVGIFCLWSPPIGGVYKKNIKRCGVHSSTLKVRPLSG